MTGDARAIQNVKICLDQLKDDLDLCEDYRGDGSTENLKLSIVRLYRIFGFEIPRCDPETFSQSDLIDKSWIEARSEVDLHEHMIRLQAPR